MDGVKRYVCLTIIIVTLSACSSIASRVNNVPCSPVYTGTVCDFYFMAAGGAFEIEGDSSSFIPRGTGALMFTFFLIDLPFSFILDTVALPVDLTIIALSDEPMVGIREPR